MKKLFTIAFIALNFINHTSAFANNASNTSQVFAAGGVSIIATPFLSLQGDTVNASTLAASVGAYVVISIANDAAESITYTLKTTEQATGFSASYLLKVSKATAQSAKITLGTSIQVVAESTGHLLLASGQVIAFIPNKIGQSLLDSTELKK